MAAGARWSSHWHCIHPNFDRHAALALALLRGREEADQLALSASVVQKIADLVETYTRLRLVMPYAQGLAELSVSDSNKCHLASVPGVIGSLRVWLGIAETAPNMPADELTKLRAQRDDRVGVKIKQRIVGDDPTQRLGFIVEETLILGEL